MKRRLTDALRPGARVFVPSLSGESALLLDELAADPERARGVQFIAVQFPGFGGADYAALHPSVRQTAFFMSPSVRRGMSEQRSELLQLDYSGIARHLEEMAPVDVAYAQVTPPDAHGDCSIGLCSDFLPLIWQRAKRRIAHVNPVLPRTGGSFSVPLSELDYAIEADAPLVTCPEPRAGEAELRIGSYIASLIRDEDTLQFGVGSVPTAIAASLTGHRRLRIHSGLLAGAARQLWEAGALDPDRRITTGVALGTLEFYRFVGSCPQIWLTDVRETHDICRIAAIPRFNAINGALAVDLFGQVNSEMAEGVLYAGAGGLPSFVRGALLSSGGRSLICLTATTKQGASRIVPILDGQSLCTLPRYLADVVVTEYGIAELRGLSLEARAQALLGIAAPRHRDSLANQWESIQRKL